MMSSDPDWEMIPKNIQITIAIFESGWWEFVCSFLNQMLYYNQLVSLQIKFSKLLHREQRHGDKNSLLKNADFIIIKML